MTLLQLSQYPLNKRLHERYDILSTAHKDHRFVIVLDEVLDEVKIKLNGDNSVALA
jgi:hypothetical protein